jgi:hypothetical protein
MNKNNISKLLEVKGFNPYEISIRLDLIKKLLKESNISIALNEERKLEKILNKIANDQAEEEDLKFCKKLCNFDSNNGQLKNSDLIYKLSKIIKNTRSSDVDEEEMIILRQSDLFKNLKDKIIKKTHITLENNNYILNYQIEEDSSSKLSFRVKFSDNKVVFSFPENSVNNCSKNFDNNKVNNEIFNQLFIEEIQIAMLEKLNIEFPDTYQMLLKSKEFIYFKHDKLSSNYQKNEINSLENIEIIRFNFQLKLAYNIEIKDPKIINLSRNYIRDSIHKKFYSYNFFKKLENSRKPSIPEVRIAI